MRGGCNSEYILSPPCRNLLPQHVRQIVLPLPNLIKPAPFLPQTVHVNAHKQPQQTLAQEDRLKVRRDDGNHNQEEIKYV